MLSEISSGVYVWAPPVDAPASSNAGVVVDSDGLTLIDCLSVSSQYEPFLQAVADLDRPIRRLVLTHSHFDHVGGAAISGASEIISHRHTAAAFGQPPAVAIWQALHPSLSKELQAFVYPEVTRCVECETDLTRRIRVEVLRGHTAADLCLVIPDSDVCFAGDLGFFGVAPLTFDGDLLHWIESLSRLEALAGTVVPGHGSVGTADELRALSQYLKACVRAADAQTPLESGPWLQWHDPWADHVSRPLDAANVEYAAMRQKGERGYPPTMVELVSRRIASTNVSH